MLFNAPQVFQEIQDHIVTQINALEKLSPCTNDKAITASSLHENPWSDNVNFKSASGRSFILENGAIFERAGVLFSHIAGDALPESALRGRNEIAGKAYRVCGVSVVVHPRNPWLPTVHFNIRVFAAANGTWWFGGGMDLTPYYGFTEDASLFHQECYNAVTPYNSDYYRRFKKACDQYFYLPHRQEYRGVGGIFFDSFNDLPFDQSLNMMRDVGTALTQAYTKIITRRVATPYSPRHKAFQQYRRGRYVEFNLLYDRGTLFGLQSGGRTNTILVSLPPNPKWYYEWNDAPDFPDKTLKEQFLQPRDWLSAHHG